jgi:hypothetical protein
VRSPASSVGGGGDVVGLVDAVPVPVSATPNNWGFDDGMGLTFEKSVSDCLFYDGTAFSGRRWRFGPLGPKI